MPKLTLVYAEPRVGEEEQNDLWLNAILAFAKGASLFEVWYPWTTEADYDVLTVGTDGVITTTPNEESKAAAAAEDEE